MERRWDLCVSLSMLMFLGQDTHPDTVELTYREAIV